MLTTRQEIKKHVVPLNGSVEGYLVRPFNDEMKNALPEGFGSWASPNKDTLIESVMFDIEKSL